MWVPLTPLDFYRRSHRLFTDRCGVVDEKTRLTFGQFGDRVERLAGALRAMGLRPKEAVTMLTANTHHLLEGFYGVPLAGGVINPINPRFAPLEIAQLGADVAALAALAGERCEGAYHADAAAAAALAAGGARAAAHLVRANLAVRDGDERLRRAHVSEQAALDAAERALRLIR